MISAIDSMIGQRFFYADEETGIGWESRIDEVTRSWDTDAVRLYLSCGTIVNISGVEVIRGNYRAFVTNLKEENE